MSRRKRRGNRGNREKNSDVELKVNQPLPVQEIHLVAVEPIAERGSIDTKLDGTTLIVKPLSETKLTMSQRRSNRRCESFNVTYQCKICQVAFPTEYNLRQHLDSYGDPRFPCEQCNTKFTNKRHLETHIASAHGCPKRKFPLKCSVCNQLFMVSAHLQSHLSHYHEDWKESVKTTELETVKTESPDLITKSRISIKTQRKRTKRQPRGLTKAHLRVWREKGKQRSATLVSNLETEQSVETNALSTETADTNTTFSTETVAANALSDEIPQNVTIPSTTVSQNPLKNEENKRDEKLTEETQSVSINALNPDILEIRVEKNYQNEDTIPDEPPICVISDVSHVPYSQLEIKMNEINYGDTRIVCMDGDNQRVYENHLADGENKDAESVTANNQVLSINGKLSQVLGSLLINSSDTTTKRNDEMERIYPIQIQNDEYKTDERLNETENTILKSDERAKQTLQDTSVGLYKPIDEVIQPFITVWCAAPNEEEVLQLKDKNEKIQTMAGSTNCVVPDDSDKIPVRSNNAKSMTLLDARWADIEMAAPSTNYQEKAYEGDAEKFPEIRNYEKEIELRRLYSCKDCYVPLIRVKSPETFSETAKATKSHGDHLPTVIASIVCDRTFVSKDMMFRHYRRHHLSFFDNKVHCVCGKEMNGDGVLDFHFYRYCQKTAPATTIATNSSGPCKPLEKNSECMGCGEKFWLESCLRSHVYSCNSYLKQKVQTLLDKSENLLTVSLKHSCRVCHTAFSSEEKLWKHNEIYSSVAIHRCFFCGTMFPGDHMLKMHMKSAHTLNRVADDKYVCTVCNQSFPNKRFERIHRMHLHRDQAYSREPETNNLSPPDSDDPGDDEKSVNKCRVCNLIFSNKKRFIDHTIYYLKSETIHCKTCGAMFEGQYRAHHHNKAVHYGEDTRSAFTRHCDICKEGFMYMEHLQAHLLHVHVSETTITTHMNQNNKDESQSQQTNSQLVESCRARDVAVPSMEYSCPVCDVQFPTQALLSEHETEFANDGEYSCNRCSKKCRTPSLLLDHLTLNHSNNAMQGGVKCRRCNENFLSQRAWICHVKHFHYTEEPSEFYLEKNIASTEEFEDIRYELIPTNESISSGVAYFKVKNSIDSSTSLVKIDEKKGADQESFVPETSSTNILRTEEGKLIDVEGHSVEVEIPEDDVVIIDEYNETTIDVSINDEKKSTTSNVQQVVNGNRCLDADLIKINDAEKKETRSAFCHLRNDRGRASAEGWACSICGYIFRSQAYLGKHMLVYADSGEYMCEICGRRFRAAEFYREHKLRHTSTKKVLYYCSSCNEGFRMYQSMKMHVAHIHPRGLQELLTAVKEDKTVRNYKKNRGTSLRARDQLSSYGYASSCSPVIATPAKETARALPALRTYSRHSDLTAPMQGKVNAPTPKPSAVNNQSLLHTKFFNDKESTIYECLSCQQNFSTVKKLDEHLMTVHRLTRDKTKLVKPSIGSDTQLPCSSCEKVFANANLLNAHIKQFHCVKSLEIVRNSDPVIEITASSSIKPKTPEIKQRSVVIGRVFKLMKINSLLKSKNSEKMNVPKVSVTRFSGSNVEQQKFSVKMTTPNKKSYAVPFKSAAAPLKRYATSTAQKKSNPAVKLTLPIENIDKQGEKTDADMSILPAAHAVQDSTNVAVQQMNLSIENAVQKTTNAAVRQLNLPTGKVFQKTAKYRKVPAANALQLTPASASNGQLKQGVTKYARMIPLTAYKQSKLSAVKNAQLIPITVHSQFKSSAATDTQLIPLTVQSQLKSSSVNVAQLIPLGVHSLLKSSAVKDSQLTPLTVHKQLKPSAVKHAHLIPLTVQSQLTSSVVKDGQLRPLTVYRKLKPLPMKDPQSSSLTVNKQSKPLAVEETQLKLPVPKDRDLKPLSEKEVKPQPPIKIDVHLVPPVARDEHLKPVVENDTQLKPQTGSDIQMKLRRLNMGTDIYPMVRTENLSLPTIEQQQLPEQPSKDSKIISSGLANRSVLKREILNNVLTLPIVSTPAVETSTIKIVKVESYSSAASTGCAEVDCQVACDDSNTIFMTINQSEYEKCAHPSTSLNDQSVDKLSIAATSPENFINQLHQLVSTLPIYPTNEIGTEAEDNPFAFESIMIPISTDEFLPEGKVDGIESESQINPLEASMTTHFASINNNLWKNNNRKRKDNGTTNELSTKRLKKVFDPIAYQKLCRQHNLELPAKRDKSMLRSTIPNTKTVEKM